MTTTTTPRTFTIERKGKPETFVSIFTDAGALAGLRSAHEAGKLGTFGQSLLLQSIRRPLSPKQMAWAHKLASEYAAEIMGATAPAAAAPAVEGGMQKIVELLQTAAHSLKYPAIVFRGLRISLAKLPDTANVTSDESVFADRTFYGRITAGGSFQARGSVPAAVVEALVELASDPAAKTAAEGKRTGACCFCRRALETAESLAVGYGPVCAEKYALPWGFPKAPKAKRASRAKVAPAPVAAPVEAPEVVELPNGCEETDGEPAERCTRCGAAWAARGAQSCASCERGVQAGLFTVEAPKPVQGSREGFEQVAPGVWRRTV